MFMGVNLTFKFLWCIYLLMISWLPTLFEWHITHFQVRQVHAVKHRKHGLCVQLLFCCSKLVSRNNLCSDASDSSNMLS